MTISEPFNHETSVAIYQLWQHCSDHIKFLNVIHFIEIPKLYFGLFKCFLPKLLMLSQFHLVKNLPSPKKSSHKCHNARCVCFLGFCLTFQIIITLKEYLSNIWRVSACYSSQKRKITGFNSEIKKKEKISVRLSIPKT